MKQETASLGDLEVILDKFSNSIKANLLKCELERKGIDPEDVIQDVKIKIWKTMISEKKMVNPASYIKRIVDSTLIDYIRRIRVQERVIQQEKLERWLEEKRHHEGSSPDAAFMEKIAGAADSLMESRRKVVKLFLLNMDLEEISLSLNWSRDKTRNLLYRGLSDLKKIIADKGDNHAA